MVDVLAIDARGSEIEARVQSLGLGLGPRLLLRVRTLGQRFALGLKSVWVSVSYIINRFTFDGSLDNICRDPS